MKTFFDWLLKALAGAIVVCIILAVGGTHILPATLPLVTVGGRTLVLNLSDAVGLVVFVWVAAAILYAVGYGVLRAISFLWSRF